MPSVQGIDDFNHNIDAAYYSDGFTGTPTGVSTPLYQTRNRTLQVDAALANEYVIHNISAAPARGWFAFPLRRDAAPSAGGLLVCEIHAVTNNTRGQIRYTGTGGILASIIGETTGSTQFATSTGTFYWVEAILDASGTTHSLYWRVNGTNQTTCAKTGLSADTVNYVALGSEASDNGLTWYTGGYWAWGSAVSTTDFLGEPSAPSGVVTGSMTLMGVG